MSVWLCALVAYFVAQVVKTAVPWGLAPVSKLLWALAGGLGAAALESHQPEHFVLYGVAGAALAVLFHGAIRVFTLVGDYLLLQITRTRPR